MSLEDFQFLDKDSIDNSIVKTDFLKIYHQQGSELNYSNQNIDFIFGENNNYQQIGNSYLEFDISVCLGFNNNAEVRLVNNGFAFCFTERTTSTTGGMEIEHVKFLGHVSIIMGVLTSKDGDFLSYFDNINDADANTSMNNISLNDRLIISHSVAVNRGKFKGHIPLEHIIGFCKTFKKNTKNLGFHLTFKTADLQNIIFTSIANDIDVTINSLYLYVPVILPDSNTQVLFIESIKNN